MLVRAGAPLKLGVEEVAAVALELRRPVGSTAGTGVLVLRLAHRSVAPATVSVAAEALAQAVGFEQKTATIVATAWLGPVSRACRVVLDWVVACPGQYYFGTSTTVVARGASERTTLLGSDAGRNAKVTLAPATADGQARSPGPGTTSSAATTEALPTATLTAKDIPGPGKYSGDVTIDPMAEQPQTIAVTVHAQDALIWPLLVVLLGALVGGLLTRRYDIWRGAKLIRASIVEAVQPYLDERPRRDRLRPDRFYLDGKLAREGGALAGVEKQFPKRRSWQRRAPEEEVPKLYWESYGVRRDERLAEVAAAARALTDRFARWQRVNTAYKELDKKLERLDTSLPIRDDGERILDLAQGEPADEEEAERRIAAMETHAQIADIYRRAEERFDRAREKLGDRWAADRESVDPAKIYALAPRLASRTPEQTASLRLDLLRAFRLLANPENIPKDKPAQSATRNLRAAFADADFAIEPFAFDVPAGTFLARVFAPRLESPEEMRRTVREWDWVVFFAVSVLTACAYLLPLYVGKDYGALTDYLGAFVAGATVPTVITWALLPLARSLRPPSPAARAA